MKIKVLGPGCFKCNKLAEAAKQAVKELGLEATVEKVSDMKSIMSYGILSTPGLVVDEEVRLTGKVPSVEEMKKILSK